MYWVWVFPNSSWLGCFLAMMRICWVLPLLFAPLRRIFPCLSIVSPELRHSPNRFKESHFPNINLQPQNPLLLLQPHNQKYKTMLSSQIFHKHFTFPTIWTIWFYQARKSVRKGYSAPAHTVFDILQFIHNFLRTLHSSNKLPLEWINGWLS